MKADLHVHSTASDGTLTPRELVELAASRNVDVLAVADHDSVAGLGEAAAHARRLDITLVTAVELSSATESGDVHILAYFVDPGAPGLLDHLAALREARLARAERIVALLAEAGYDISLGDVLELSGGGAVGRSHVARALVASGAAESTSDAFARLIGRERPFYVAKDSQSPQAVVRMVREFGAIPVLAHPGVSRSEHLIDPLVEAGLLGIEAYHADHTPEQRERFASLSEERGLLVTGGTDFHGHEAPNPSLGTVEIPERHVEAFLRAGAAL